MIGILLRAVGLYCSNRFIMCAYNQNKNDICFVEWLTLKLLFYH